MRSRGRASIETITNNIAPRHCYVDNNELKIYSRFGYDAYIYLTSVGAALQNFIMASLLRQL